MKLKTTLVEKSVLENLAESESNSAGSPRCVELVACSEGCVFICRKIGICNMDMEVHQLYKIQILALGIESCNNMLPK